MAFSDGKNLYVVECKSGELKNKRVSFDCLSRDHASLILFNWDQPNLNRFFLICSLNLALMPQSRQLKTPFLEFGLKRAFYFILKRFFSNAF
ncbi:hypothetical protein BB434_07560 [Helicobacter pylori]|nr:hypothetical protein GZ76_04005 [Helicobacter pylori]PDW48394.1 hypothetical protein BB434_07560 [Helicobacter pylori]